MREQQIRTTIVCDKMASKRRSRGASSQFLNTSLGSQPGGRTRPAPLQRSQSSVSSWSGWSAGSWGGPAAPRLVKPASEYPENFRKIVENFQRSVERDCQRKPRSASTPSIPNTSGKYIQYTYVVPVYRKLVGYLLLLST